MSRPSYFDYIIEEILEFDKDEIKLLNQLRYRIVNTITRRITLTSLDKELAYKDMNMGMYKTLCDWIFYVNTY